MSKDHKHSMPLEHHQKTNQDPQTHQALKEGRLRECYKMYEKVRDNQRKILSCTNSQNLNQQYQEQVQILERDFHEVFSTTKLEEMKAAATEEYMEDLKNLYRRVLNTFLDTLLILVSEDLPKMQILKEMITWMSQDSACQEVGVTMIISQVLSFASETASRSKSIYTPCLGVLAAELSLLCFHRNEQVTQHASVGLYHLLCIAKHHSDLYPDKKFSRNDQRLLYTSEIEFQPNVLYRNKFNIAQYTGQNLVKDFVVDFVWTLLIKISEDDFTTACKAASILHLTLEFHSCKVWDVARILETIHKQLLELSSPELREAVLQVVMLLTRTDPNNVIFELVRWTSPVDRTLILMWQAMGGESSSALKVLEYILIMLKDKPHDIPEENPDFSINPRNMMPVTACQALCTLLPLATYRKAVARLFPSLLMALLLQILFHSELSLRSEAEPCYAQEALRVLLQCSGLQDVDTKLEEINCWAQFSEVLFHKEGVLLVAKALCEHDFPQFQETLQYVSDTALIGSRSSEATIITVIVLTELLNKDFKEEFPKEFLFIYQNWVSDSCPVVSEMSLRTITRVASIINNIENASGLLTTVLGALDSKNKNVILQALHTLRQLLSKLDKMTYSSMLSHITSRYYRLMIHICPDIRSTAIWNLGQLLEDMSQNKKKQRNVVFEVLVALVLFLEDTEIVVARAAQDTLGICALQLQWNLGDLLRCKHLNYEQVVLSICNHVLISKGHLISELIGGTLDFLPNPRECLKRASIILLGYLVKLGSHLLLREEMDVILEALSRLLFYENLEIKDLARRTYSIFEELLPNITSSSFKKACRLLFHFLYTQRVTLLYNLPLKGDLELEPPQGCQDRQEEKAEQEAQENLKEEKSGCPKEAPESK